jgi:hypothetical protein
MRVWPTTLVRHCIYIRFGIAYGRERGRHVLHACRCRWRRRRSRHLQAAPQEQGAFVHTLPEQLQAWPEEQELLCVAEATVRRPPPRTAPWGLADAVPEVPTGAAHTKVPVYGAVAPLTGRTH